uniref:MBD domain-containing protein n=1 Tax=Chenopodium quinoa TaxID=63459 RepID=A0A803LH90_CHEQI
MASEVEKNASGQEEVVSMELPAPSGWKKQAVRVLHSFTLYGCNTGFYPAKRSGSADPMYEVLPGNIAELSSVKLSMTCFDRICSKVKMLYTFGMHGEDIADIQLFFPKRGGTPRKNEIVFTAPTGEEIHSQRQLQQYLKSHPGGPPASEFDWGTGETPRRSARISEKVKASPTTPESDTPKKRSRKSSASKMDSKDGEATAEETKTEEIQMDDAEKIEKKETDEGANKDVEMQEIGKTETETEKLNTNKSEGDKTSIEDAEKQGPLEPAGKQDSLQEQVKEDAVIQDPKESEGDKAAIEDADLEAGKQGPQEPAEKQEGLLEQVKEDAEEGKKDAAADPDARNIEYKIEADPSQVTTVVENTVGGDNTKAAEQPHSEKQDSMPEQVKPEADVNIAAKDNGTAAPEPIEPKGKDSVEGDINKKVLEVIENGSQAGEARS